jgi:adenosylhomocysteine nucleosidase
MSRKFDATPPPIALIAALPEEVGPLLARAGFTRKERISGFLLYRSRFGGQDLLLLQSGMGPKNAETATRALLNSFTPKLIINFGLGGAVAAGPRVADLVLAIRLLVSEGEEFHEQSGLTLPLAEEFMAAAGDGSCLRGTFITAAETMPKAALLNTLPAGTETPVLEMETAAVARVTSERGIPLLAVRAVSDDCDEELGFTVAEFCDANLRIRPLKVLATILKRPGIVPQLIRLAGNSRRAAEALATGIIAYLERIHA